MAKRILKYFLFDFDNMKNENDAYRTIDLDVQATILKVGVQEHKVCLWAVENSDAPTTKRKFVVYGTGSALDEGKEHRFIGTVFMGPYVWHVFEQK